MDGHAERRRVTPSIHVDTGKVATTLSRVPIAEKTWSREKAHRASARSSESRRPLMSDSLSPTIVSSNRIPMVDRAFALLRKRVRACEDERI